MRKISGVLVVKNRERKGEWTRGNPEQGRKCAGVERQVDAFRRYLNPF